MQWRRHQENGALVLPALQLICYLHEENKVKNKAHPLTFPNFFDFSAYLSQKVQVSQVQYFPDGSTVRFPQSLSAIRLILSSGSNALLLTPSISVNVAAMPMFILFSRPMRKSRRRK